MTLDTGLPTKLAESLAEATAGATLNVKLLQEAMTEAAYTPHDLFSTNGSKNAADMVRRCEEAMAGYTEKKAKVPRQLVAEHRMWMGKLAVGLERERLDALRQAEHPGCVCLGYGGRYPKEGLTVATPDGRLVSDPTVTVYRDICPCPLGDEARARIAEAKTRLLAEDQQRRFRRLWDDLKLPQGLGESITFDTHVDQVKMALVKRWYAGEFKPGLVIAGLNQRGKTTTAYLLAQQAIRDGLGVVGMTVPDLLGRLIDTFSHDERLKADPEQPPQATHQALIESLQVVPFLLLDDLGVEKLSDYVERALYQILNARADAGLRTVITTNLKKDEIAARFGARIYSRISKLCDRVVFEDRMIGPAAGGLQDLEDLAE